MSDKITGSELIVSGVDGSSMYEYLGRFEITIGNMSVSRDYTLDSYGNWITSSAALVFDSSMAVTVDDSMLAIKGSIDYPLRSTLKSPQR